MSVSSESTRRVVPPEEQSSNPEDAPYVPEETSEEANGLYLSPAAEQWIATNVQRPGWVIDWGTREILDPNTGEVKGRVPVTFAGP